MLIVWGHNNFRIKSVAPHEIGMLDSELSGFTFELRQKYGHLFWIPFIPLGKFWVVKKPNDDKLYHCHPEIEMQLEQQFPKWTSIFAWTGPLLILAGFLFFSIADKVEDYRREIHAGEAYSAAADSLAAKVNAIKPNDYLLFSIKPNGRDYYDNRKEPLKVVSVNGDNIELRRISSNFKSQEEDIPRPASEGTAIVSNNFDEYNAAESIINMESNYGTNDNFTVSKKTLLNSICHDSKDENKFAGVSIKNFTTQGNCKLSGMLHVGTGPILKLVDLSEEKRDGKYYELTNVGYDVHADSIVTSKQDGTWMLSKERHFSYGDKIAIKCNSKDSAVLYTSDSKNRVYKNKIDNTGFELRFEQSAQ